MRALRFFRCRSCSMRLLVLLLMVLAFIVYCFYYSVAPAYPKP
ncbi:jg10259, partial [Pararge aegeria aegeria]